MLLSLGFSRLAPLQGLKSLKICPLFYMFILKDIYFKRCLLLERKAMTKLDSILKSRDITLPTKVCQVKAMVFLVVMYRCESWIIKKAVWQNHYNIVK